MWRFEEDQRWNRGGGSAQRPQGGSFPPPAHPLHPHSAPLPQPAPPSSSFPSGPSGATPAPPAPHIGSEARPALGPSRFQLASASQWSRLPSRKPPEPLRRAVAACLSSGTLQPSSEAVRTLQDYLSNPFAVDLAFMVLLEHANAERDRSPPVIAKCVALLKRYLIRYVPKQATLQQIDIFCATLINECNSFGKAPLASPLPQFANDPSSSRQTGGLSVGLTKATFASGALVKSLTYVRSLVARHLPTNLLQSPRMVDLPHFYSKRNRSFHAPYGSGGKQGFSENKGPETSGALNFLGSEENDEWAYFIATDLLKWRWMGGKRQQCWTPSPVMTDRQRGHSKATSKTIV